MNHSELTDAEMTEISRLRCELLHLANTLEDIAVHGVTKGRVADVYTHVCPTTEQMVFGSREILRTLDLAVEGRCRVCHEIACICTEGDGQEQEEDGIHERDIRRCGGCGEILIDRHAKGCEDCLHESACREEEQDNTDPYCAGTLPPNATFSSGRAPSFDDDDADDDPFGE